MNFKVVLLDANVLYSAPLRDVLVQLAVANFYEAKWTEEIHQEWIESLLRNRSDLKLSTLESVRDLMNRKVSHCVVTNYEHLIPKVVLPDPNDRHVLAAAIVGKCDTILTYNLNDFPKSALGTHNISAVHPDEFLLNHMSLSPSTFCKELRKIRNRLNNPAYTVSEYLDRLTTQGLVNTVAALHPYSAYL